MTMWAVTQTNRFKAAVSGAGLSDWLSYYGTNDIDTWMIPYFGNNVYDDATVYARSSPINYIKQVKTPTLMVAGDRDAEVPVTQSYEYWHALRDLGRPDRARDLSRRRASVLQAGGPTGRRAARHRLVRPLFSLRRTIANSALTVSLAHVDVVTLWSLRL